jgi:hypothetical protein
MISFEKNFLFVHIKRTGGTSVESVLDKYSEDRICLRRRDENFEVRNDELKTRKHSPLSQYKEVIPKEKYDNLFKFTIIRNTWERVFSYYNYYIYTRRLPFDRMQFIEFIQKRVQPIRWYICCDDSEQLNWNMNMFLHFEDLAEHFKVLCKKIDIPHQDLPFINKLEYSHYTDYIDDRIRNLIGEKFKEEIEFFDFEFGKRVL